MRKRTLLAGIAAVLFTVPAAAQTTVINEKFENGFGQFTPLGQVAVASGQAYSNVGFTGTNPAALTNHFAAFGGGNSFFGGNIFSVTFNTIAGQLYRVSFDYQALGARGTQSQFLMFGIGNNGTNVFNATFNPLAAQSVDTPFRSFTTTFTGNGSAYVLSFLGQGQANDNSDILVDNVLVNAAVPEPATWGMMILGFGVIGASMRRRRTSVRYAAA